MRLFIDELTELINRHSGEDISDLPGYMLADYLISCISALNYATKGRIIQYDGHLEWDCLHNKKNKIGKLNEDYSSFTSVQTEILQIRKKLNELIDSNNKKSSCN